MPTLMQGNNPIGVINKSGGSGGHVIQDASGTDMTQRANMQFVDAHLTDDDTNDKTEVEVIKSVASADYSLETEDGLYLIPDGDGSVIEPASEDYVEVTADGVKTYAQLLEELETLYDSSKVTGTAYIILGTEKYDLQVSTYIYTHIRYVSDAGCFFAGSLSLLSHILYTTALYPSGTTVSNLTNNVPSNGLKITLYYGNKKAVVDLQTTANRCLMSDGTTTVEQALTTNIISETETVAPIVGQSVYKDFTMPNDGKKYACTVTVALGASKSAKAEMWASGTALLSSIAAAFINVSDMPIDCAQTMTLFANGNGGNLRAYIWTRSTDCDTYTIKLNAVSI